MADEPTGNLDSRAASRVMELFGQLAGSGKTVVLVTHNTAHTTPTSRVVEIVDGQVQ